jgi:hypothetical protein
MGRASGGGVATRVKVAGGSGKGGIIPERREAQRFIPAERVTDGCPKASNGGGAKGGGAKGGGAKGGGAKGGGANGGSGGGRACVAAARAGIPCGIKHNFLRRRIASGIGGGALRGSGARAGAAGSRKHKHLRRSGSPT